MAGVDSQVNQGHSFIRQARIYLTYEKRWVSSEVRKLRKKLEKKHYKLLGF